MSDRQKEIAAGLAKLDLIEAALQEMYRENEATIQSLSWQNQRIAGSIRDVRFVKFMYGSLTDTELDQIPEVTYPAFLGPLNSVIEAGGDYSRLAGKSAWVHGTVSGLSSGVSAFSAVITGSTGDTAANMMSLEPFVQTARFASAVRKYLEEVRVDGEIAYIKTEVAKLAPSLPDEFQHFLDMYFASEPSESKYQELIGSRTLFYQRTVFREAERIGVSAPPHSRRDQIEAFIYGQNPVRDSAVSVAAAAAESLWKELSSQDSAGLSVKMGNVTPTYVTVVFDKTVVVFSTLLRLRALHFRP